MAKPTLITVREVGTGRTRGPMFEVKSEIDGAEQVEHFEQLEVVVVARRRCWEALDNDGKSIARAPTAQELKNTGARIRRKVQIAVLILNNNLNAQAMLSVSGWAADDAWNACNPLVTAWAALTLAEHPLPRKGQGTQHRDVYPIECKETGDLASEEVITFCKGWQGRLAPWLEEWPEPPARASSWVL